MRFHHPKTHLSPKEWHVDETERYTRANAVGELLDRASLIRPNLATAAEKVPTVLPYFDLLTNATACFGQCGLVARNYDRAVALDLRAERRDGLLADIGKHNDAGLAQVTFARSALAQMGKEITAAKLSKKFVRARLQECADEFRLAPVDWDMKGTDAEKIDDVLTEAIDLVNKMGVAAPRLHRWEARGAGQAPSSGGSSR